MGIRSVVGVKMSRLRCGEVRGRNGLRGRGSGSISV